MRPATGMMIATMLGLGWQPALTASAASSFDNCTGFIDSVPAAITTQGTWCLRGDLSTGISTGIAINIKANNVTLDCNNYKLGGLAAGLGTSTAGILASNRQNVTVRNCNVRGFNHGIYLVGSGSRGHIVEDNNANLNTHMGLRADGAGSVIRRNVVLDTGGSSIDPAVYGIMAGYSTDILDNTVSGLRAGVAGVDAVVIGIYTFSNLEGSVSHNRIRGISQQGSESTLGIYNKDSQRLTLVGNQVTGDASAGSTGISCTNTDGRAKDNIISGFAQLLSGCAEDGNTLVP